MNVRRRITSGEWLAYLDVDETSGRITWIFPGLSLDHDTHFAYTPLDEVPDLIQDLKNAFSAYQALARAVQNDTLNEVERFYEGRTGRFPYRTGPLRGVEFLINTDGYAERICGPFDFNCVIEVLEEALRLIPELREIAQLNV